MLRNVLLVGLLLSILAILGPVRQEAEANPGLTFTVNSTSDTSDASAGDGICDDGTGSCTLRAAIEEANAKAGTDTIAFNIPGTGLHTIQPSSALPTVTDPVVIDGYTQPGATPNTLAIGDNAVLLIELNGTTAGGIGLWISAGSSTVRGLAINRFEGGSGIYLSGGGASAIEGNFIGTNATGTAARGNSGGVSVSGPDDRIGGSTPAARNLISGNLAEGIHVYQETGTLIEGNYVGTNAAGTAFLGNVSRGIEVVSSSSTTIGGAIAGAGNVVSGNDRGGVRIIWGNGNLVQGNFIGTDASGSAALGNFGEGLRIEDSLTNTVGGTTPQARNIISGGNHVGVWITGANTTAVMGNVVEGNFIGTDVTGTVGLGNAGDGVHIFSARGNVIGGTTPGAGNIISANTEDGIAILGGLARENKILGNFIGTKVDGINPLGNSKSGVSIQISGRLNAVGGNTGGSGNTIAYNNNGVLVDGASSTGNAIRANSIHSNIARGIDNSNGGNMELAPPVIDGAGTSVWGHTAPKCYPCTVDVFADGDGQGRIYHGSATTNNDATGTWTYPGGVTGSNVTATITDADSNTSEFSLPIPAFEPTPTPTFTPTPTITPTPTATLCPGDSDCDGVLDAVDNCLLVSNPDQLNSDGGRRPNGLGLPGDWASNPAQDKLGDACDSDDDNDALPDSQEFDDHCPYRLVADSDGDGALDGHEVANGFDPCNAASRPTWVGGADSDGDRLLDGSERGGYNTCAFAGDTMPGWATCVVPQDSDRDGCSDTVEVLDLNGDRTADSGDQGRLNRRIAGLILPDAISEQVFDVNKDGFIDAGDQGLMNRNNCITNPNQLGCPMCPAE